MKTYSFGDIPENIIRAQLPDFYPIQLTSKDYALFAKLVNIGIDSRLTAINISNEEINKIGYHASFSLDRDSMICLLNRLWDYSLGGNFTLLSDDEKENALSLRTTILSTLDIEEL